MRKLRKNAKPLPPLYQLTINGDWVEVCPFCSRPVSGGGLRRLRAANNKCGDGGMPVCKGYVMTAACPAKSA